MRQASELSFEKKQCFPESDNDRAVVEIDLSVIVLAQQVGHVHILHLPHLMIIMFRECVGTLSAAAYLFSSSDHLKILTRNLILV